MRLNKDITYRKLSNKTLRQIDNICKNCNDSEFLDHAVVVFHRAADRGEIKRADMWRLAAKTYRIYNEKKNHGK